MASRTLFTRASTLLRVSYSQTSSTTGSISMISRSTPIMISRAYHPTPSLSTDKDFAEDRTTLKPRRSEGSSYASDDDIAHLDKTAFDPKNTSPNGETESAGKESNGNPLETSGANREFSRPQGDNPTEGDMSKGTKTPGMGKDRKKSGGPAAGSKKGGKTHYQEIKDKGVSAKDA
ncbi:hypothetical protein SMACR_03887 [Sordaria macrospora]|uniref:WGS project CABT00000000 data, contig 2.16 n=2 Tax=Sordaria macrospora TaxID=5147 RepID=F7W082_SORMK|nr:uncharacterized protein SMAC_03887 [Sordaria macrospora k-hell]KAA8631162.1 hypothetical protein SMACR_03887 [Sordaria macrospora]WPJ66457.1 hypothetical protein SMAC4_03887 [Sordaria macrospora]CCC11181.1 unnamed protein product [Sordaria macrospora k-hell]